MNLVRKGRAFHRFSFAWLERGQATGPQQLIHNLLCVDDGIPIYTKCEDGNASDKVINENLFGR